MYQNKSKKPHLLIYQYDKHNPRLNGDINWFLKQYNGVND